MLVVVDEEGRTIDLTGDMADNAQPWDITFEGSVTVEDRTGKKQTICGRMHIEASDERAWVLHMTLGIATLPMISVAGNNDTPYGVIREAILTTVRAVAATKSPDETPQ